MHRRFSKQPKTSSQEDVAGGSTTQLLYDGADQVAEYDGAGNLLRRYVHGPVIDEPLVVYL